MRCLKIVDRYNPNPIPKFNEAIPAFPPGTQGINRGFGGEIGARIPAEHSTDHGNLWPELSSRDNAPKNILYERLTLLAQKNYELALIWPEQEDAGSDTVTSKLKLDKIRGLVRFTGGSFPDI